VKKRVLASLLTLCLLVGLLPTTVLAKGSGRFAGKINLSFYYAYSNTIPDPAQGGGTTAQEYGPSGNDVPLRTAEVDLDALFDKLGNNASSAKSIWEDGDKDGQKYITAASCGYENNADWWELVVSCMTNVDDQTYFTEGVGAELYQGYVIKKVDKSNYPYHCDGILLEKPPLYLVEIEDVTNHHYIGTLTSNSETEFTAGSVQEAVKEYLLEEYGEGTINWNGSYYDGIFTGEDASYKVELAYDELNKFGTIEYTKISDGYYLATVKVTLDKFFTITYDANGGQGPVPVDEARYSGYDLVSVQFTPEPTRDGYDFLGWDEDKDATDPYYTETGHNKFNITDNTTLYAIWERNVPTYTLTYDANGGYWGTTENRIQTETDLPTPDETDGWHTLSYSDAETAPTHDPVNETDILFVGWSLAEEMKGEILDKDGTPIGLITSGSINMNQSFTVYAVWAEDSNGNDVPDYQEEAITVNFNLKGGTTTDTTSFTLKPFPEKTDIKFGTAPAVTPPTGQEFVNWTLQGDSTKTLGNKAGFTYDSIFEMTGGKKTTVTFEANYQSSNAITITPADITIYMGGDGYEGTVTDEEGDMAGSGTKNGFPEPGFTVTLPQSLKDADMSKLFLRYEEADVVSYTWKFEKYGEGNHNIYRIVPVEGTASRPVRLEFKKGDLTITEDTFDVNLNLNQTLDMTVYGEGIDQELVFFEYEGNQYDISVGTGNLTVRGTSDHAQYGVVNKEIADGAPGLEAESGTTYVVNDSTVTVEDPSGIALLFDDVIETNTVENVTNTDLLEAKADTYLGGADPDRQYEFKYLDLVDQNNGNAWVKANGTLTVYWPLPADADPDTLQILHFADVDRSTEADDIAGEISGCEVEKVTIKEVTGTHVVFEVTNSSFSPFALVYETKTTPPQETVTVTFKVVNGTWSNGSSSNIKVTVTKGDSLTRDQIPTGMEPDPGYKKTGSWNTTPNTTRKLNSNVTYTYTFTKSGDTEPEDEDCILYFESNGGTEFKKIDNGNDSFRINPYSDSEYGQHIPSRPGYRFTGWYRDEDLENRISESTKINVNSIMTIYAGWERTSVPSMLNGDDHYAYIQGYADGTVRPNANITRAQVATIFFRLLDEDVRSDYLTTYNTFPDVNADYWANTAISTMASLGVINGRNSGLFDPDAYITRAEFAAICARFDDSNVSGFDSFTDTFGHWAEEEIGRAAALGWIQGYDDGTFRPNQYITRAQAVTMINRVLCRLPEDEDDLLPGMSVWTDCREGDWCYLAIQEATNSHDYVTKDRVYETWTDLNRAPDWSRYE